MEVITSWNQLTPVENTSWLQLTNMLINKNVNWYQLFGKVALIAGSAMELIQTGYVFVMSNVYMHW